jgi:hypothetical protein
MNKTIIHYPLLEELFGIDPRKWLFIYSIKRRTFWMGSQINDRHPAFHSDGLSRFRRSGTMHGSAETYPSTLNRGSTSSIRRHHF